MKIAWIGTGVMGKAMLQHLFAAGHEVYAYNRTLEKAADLKAKGISVCSTIETCVAQKDVVFTMVGYPEDVEEIYFGKDGILTHAKPGALLIDMTTSSPKLAIKIAAAAKAFQVLDAPVSGGDSGARNAALSIMVGGEKEAFLTAKPLFETMGTNICYMGPSGSGQHTKAANQIAVAGATAAMSEALYYTEQAGLNPEQVLAAITKGAAGSWQLTNMAPRVLKEDFAPGFYIKHFIKDMHIVQDVMNEHHIHLEMLDTVCSMYEDMMVNGMGNEGTQSLIKYYQKAKEK